MPGHLLSLLTSTDSLSIDAQSGRLVSFRTSATPDQEFIASSPDHPVFVIHYLDQGRRYQRLDSRKAESTHISLKVDAGVSTVTASFRRVGGMNLDVTATIRASRDDPFTHWGITVSNGAGLEIADVQYPFIVCTYDLRGIPGSEAIVLPHGYGSGRLIMNPREAVPDGAMWKQKLAPDSDSEWEFCSRNGDCSHYPGMQFAQFLAYYNDRAGLYLACNDTSANIKRFLALHRSPGVRLGVAHVGDWSMAGSRTLEYDTLLRGFTGDWYDAADLYREWSYGQKWFVHLHERKDIPDWLTDSPVYITIRPQGMLDAGDNAPREEFLPYDKCFPLLETVAKKVQAPLAVILMGWERAGSWVYPDALPPVGGDQSMADFVASVRKRGWHAGSFCNGTRWVVGHGWRDYDGRQYFAANGGEESVCREADGTPWKESWDAYWRPSYACCLGAEKTVSGALEFVKHLIGWGMESLQFLDQNNGSSVFPCFSADHGHPPAPGKWMARSMKLFMERLHAAAKQAGEATVVQSAEAGLNETCLPMFQLTELRTYPPGYGVDVIPLYQYLFHECVILQGMMGNAPEPYHLAIRNAVNCVFGGIPGGVLTGDGTLLDKDTNNWGVWDPKVEKSENAFSMIRAVTALRRGAGKNFLVHGRMLRPPAVENVNTIRWTTETRDNAIPAVFHCAWQAPDGRFGVVLANWTDKRQKASILDSRLGSTVIVSTSSSTVSQAESPVIRERIDVRLPALSAMLLVRKN